MQPEYTPKDIVKFWGHVDKESSNTFYNGERCWIWTLARDADGYGRVRMGEKVFGAHRVSYELAFGGIPNDSLVCHHCDNTSCCNPSHFFLGTHKDNADDMIDKGRHWRQIR